MAERTVTLDIFRYHPERDTEPAFREYQVPYREEWVVLDAINHIKDHIDGGLSYRWSCRMGVCGSCGMMINGVPRLSCATFLKEFYPHRIRVEPLAHFPVARDLVIEMDDFMTKLPRVQPWIVRKGAAAETAGAETVRVGSAPEAEFRQTPAQLDRFKQFSMCINCMICYAACPVYGLEPKFLGPAAIALAQRYNLDSRDQGASERRTPLGGHHGIWDCTLVGECTVVCPAGVDPAGAIQQAKLTEALARVREVVTPWGRR